MGMRCGRRPLRGVEWILSLLWERLRVSRVGLGLELGLGSQRSQSSQSSTADGTSALVLMFMFMYTSMSDVGPVGPEVMYLVSLQDYRFMVAEYSRISRRSA